MGTDESVIYSRLSGQICNRNKVLSELGVAVLERVVNDFDDGPFSRVEQVGVREP